MSTTPDCDWAEVIARIRDELDTLSPQNRKVAACILQDPMLLGVCGIEDFSARCTVPVTSVFRFARHLGFSGFRCMRLACKQALSRQLYRDPRMVGLQSLGGLS